MNSIVLAITLFLGSLFGTQHVTPPPPISVAVALADNQRSSSQELAVTSSGATATSSSSASSNTPSSDTTLSQNVKYASNSAQSAATAPSAAFVTQSQLTSEINNLRALIYQLAASTTTAFTDRQIAGNGNGVYYGEVAAPAPTASSIISGLTASEIPALNYFPATSTIDIAYGGTGTSTRPSANELMLSDALGNWEYVATSSLGISGGGGTFTAIGPAGQTQTGPTVTLASSTNTTNGLTSALTITASGNAISFAPSLSGTLTVAGGGTGWDSISAGSLLFGNGSSALATSSNLFWDNTNGRLGIGTSTPGSIFSVQGVANWTTATSTYSSSGGINLSAGCFAVNGTCVSGGGSGTVGSGTQGQVPFYNAAGTALTASSSLFIASSGNVGIGTTSPYKALTIAGDAYANNLFASTSLVVDNGQTQFVFKTRSDSHVTLLPVPYVQPTTANTGIAFDIMPKGTVSSNQLGAGIAWMDVIGQDVAANDAGGYNGVRIAAQTDRAAIGSDAGSPQTPLPLDIFGPNILLMNSESASLPSVGQAFAYVAGNSTSGSHLDEVIANSASNSSANFALYNDQNSITRSLLMSYTGSGYSGPFLTNGLTGESGNITTVGNYPLLFGTDDTARLTVSGNGNVGIGATTPYARLSVWGPDSASSTLAFNVVSSASSTVFAVFDGGNAELSGTLTQSSDQRLKTNVQSLDASSTLSLIDQLNPVTFNWIDPNQGNGPQVGFIAQQVQQLFPELVSTTSPTALTPNGTLGLNYIGLISPIVSAIQALDREITALANTVAAFAQSFTSQTITATNELCVSDGPNDPSPICLTKAQLAALLASNGSAGNQSPAAAQQSPAATSSLPESVTQNSTNSASSTEATTPPTITINGDNPAVIQVGATYSDLGATVTDTSTGQAGDANLGYQTFLNGIAVQSITIDTSDPATDTIDYVATDSTGLTATSTRTVLIEASAATSTAQ